jgi:hypothetical protein
MNDSQDLRQRRWDAFNRWMVPPLGFAVAGAVLLATGRSGQFLTVVDVAVSFVTGYALMFALLSIKAYLGGYHRARYTAELHNFLMPGAHCFWWTTGIIVEWAFVILVARWAAFGIIAEWLGHNPLNPAAGGVGGAVTGAVDGLAFGFGYAVWGWAWEALTRRGEPGTGPNAGGV